MSDESGQANTGGRSLVHSVGANWIGTFVLMVSGFVLPRRIGDCRGQSVLGVWDFA